MLRRALAVWITLVACDAPVEPAHDASAFGDAEPLVAALATAVPGPPGVAPTLTASQALPNQPITWTISDLDPGERVYLGRSPRLGSGPCLGPAGGLCLDIAGTVVVQGTPVADAAGVATFTLNLPLWAPIGQSFAFQAVAVRGPNGADSVASNPLLVTVDDLDDSALPTGLAGRPSNTACIAPDRPSPPSAISLTRRYAGAGSFSVPVALLQRPGDASYWYVGEQSGRVERFANSPTVSGQSRVLDIASRVNSNGSELGMLALAFHPDFPAQPYLYVAYTASSFGLQSRISRFTSTDGGATFDPSSELIILQVPQPYSNHNGGQLGFGPDGYLYWGFGDGGSADDPGNRGQNPNTLLGSFVRLDVDGGTPYAIPADNPFASGVGGAPEVWAWGLRNPFRWSFDRATGVLYAGDVGQDAFEEISVIEGGRNYGWKVMEGNFCANPGAGTCNDPAFTPPLYDYSHGFGSRSVIGGYVYRGSNIPNLQGTYLFGEFYTGEIFGLTRDSITGDVDVDRLVQRSGLQMATFAEDVAGELYVLDYAGIIYEVTSPSPGTTAPFPQQLSDWPCFDPADPWNPGPELVPYEPSSTLWSDGLSKERFFAIPDGTTIDVGQDGDFALPPGSVTVKRFSVPGRRVETRLFVRHLDGEYGAYTYRWNDAQTDATWVPSGATVPLSNGSTWSVPDQAACMTCHTDAAGRTLGLELKQLTGSLDYGGTTAVQLHTLESAGFFTDPVPSHRLFDGYPGLADPASVTDRARSYLHTNCSNCHRPGGGGLGTQDLRFSTRLRDAAVCDVQPANGSFGIANARVLAPGDRNRSVLWTRMASTDPAQRMPVVGSAVPHADALDVVGDWIDGLNRCP